MEEIANCFDVRSPITHIDVMKGVQVCYTTTLENVILYSMVEVKTATTLLVTATDKLAERRMDNFVIPMIQQSGVEDLVRSNDENNARKTGRTKFKIEWEGGGLLLANGAQSPNNARSLPIRINLGDEVDGWPLIIGDDGDTVEVYEGRSKSFPHTKKVGRGSTPLRKDTSRIWREYKLGDQRKYHVKCLGCGELQPIRWETIDEHTGEKTGITWETDERENLVPGSVRWVCRCGHEHRNADKARLLAKSHGAQWVPTATPEHPNRRSYHVPALISPVGLQTWEDCVRDFLRAYDPIRKRVRHIGKYQAFYNLILGMPFEDPSSRKLSLAQVSPHRRDYLKGEVPNKWLVERAVGHPVGLVVCTVDVHKTWLAVGTWGITRGERLVLLDYQKLEGLDLEQNDDGAWSALAKHITETTYTADDGKRYQIACTAIDAGYLDTTVFNFVHEYTSTMAFFGRTFDKRKLSFKYFEESRNKLNLPAFTVHVDAYKDKLSAALSTTWDGALPQPPGHFNAPRNATDGELKELTVEKKVEVVDPKSGEHEGWKWDRPNGSRNELFDLGVYARAALDIIALEVCPVDNKREFILNYERFWDICEGVGGQPPRYFVQT
jgi:phage terminase large subunit GpA-like protein